jgi:hypothetical protein
MTGPDDARARHPIVSVIEYATSSPSRMVPAWTKFYDAVIGGGLTHDGDPRLVRHVGNMVLKVDRAGPRPVKEDRGSPRLDRPRDLRRGRLRPGDVAWRAAGGGAAGA